MPRVLTPAKFESKPEIPRAIAEGVIAIGDVRLPCAVLDDPDNTRVLTQRGMLRAIGRSDNMKSGVKSVGEELPTFLRQKNLSPFISNDLRLATNPVVFRPIGARTGYAYKAELLPKVCWVYAKAFLAGKLYKSQKHVGEACIALLDAFTDQAIRDMVDRASGFNPVDDILKQTISDNVALEAREWVKTFHDALYHEIFRLNGWDETDITKRPSVIAKWTNDFYERLAPGVLAEIKRRVPRNSEGKPTKRFHQMLTEEIGKPKLDGHLNALLALMRISSNWLDFQDKLMRAFPRYGDQIMLFHNLPKQLK